MISELISSVNNDIDELTLTIERAGIIMDYTYNKYLAESAQEELDILTEEVSLDHPEGKAQEGLVGSSVKIIKKVIASLVAAVRSMFEKIVTALNDAKYKLAMKKAKKLSKENSKLKNKTVKVYDPSNELKVIAKYRDFLNAKLAKAKAGKADNVADEVSKESESYQKKLNAAKIAGAITVTFAAAIVIIKKYSDKVGSAGQKAITGTVKEENLNGKTPTQSNAIVKVVNELARAAKDEAAAISKAITSAMSALRDGVVGTSNIETNDATAKKDIKKTMESTNDIDVDDVVSDLIREAEDNVYDTKELVDTFEEAVSIAIDDDFDPDNFLDIYEQSHITNEDSDIDASFNIAEFVVNSALSTN